MDLGFKSLSVFRIQTPGSLKGSVRVLGVGFQFGFRMQSESQVRD